MNERAASRHLVGVTGCSLPVLQQDSFGFCGVSCRYSITVSDAFDTLFAGKRWSLVSTVSGLPGQGLRCCGDLISQRFRYRLILTQQALCFLQNKIRVHERFIADVLPANATFTVDQERAVQWLTFEIVITSVTLEDVELIV